MKHLHSIDAHESGQVLTEAALSEVFMWVEMLQLRFFFTERCEKMALIFFDLDGTILINGNIVAGIKETFDLLRSKGHVLAIATGRNPNLVKGIDTALEIKHLVLANGSYVSSNGKVIHENYISHDDLKKMMSLSDHHRFDLTIEYIDAYVNYRQDTDASEKFSKHFDLPLASYDREYYPNRDVFALVMYKDEDVNKIKDEFPALQFNKAAGMAYDINPAGDLKAEGVLALIKYLGFDIKDTYAFGDNYNDITMIKAVGYGIAMGNAVDDLKKVSSYVTDDVDKQGIEKALYHFGLL